MAEHHHRESTQLDASGKNTKHPMQTPGAQVAFARHVKLQKSAIRKIGNQLSDDSS